MLESSEPYSADEYRLIEKTADEMSVEFGQLVRLLVWTGIHPSNITDLNPESLIKKLEDGVEKLYLSWVRVKNKKPVDVPVAAALLPWLPEFLASSRPDTRSAYNKRLKKIEHRLTENGFRIKVNPRRFRHTACVKMVHELKMPSSDVCRLLGVTPQTLVIYAERPIGLIYDEMKAKGW